MNIDPKENSCCSDCDSKTAQWSEFLYAGPIAFLCIVLFVALQKTGLVNVASGETLTYGTAFIVGVVASLSTCTAVVGGLVLSMSAVFAKTGDRVRPQVLFHGARLASFFLLGGAIGSLGAVLSLNADVTFVLGLCVALVMLVLGIDLLDVFPWVKKLRPSMPSFISRRAQGVTGATHIIAPIVLGVASFFLPCGFTQSMQVYTLSTGSFLDGGLTMLFFALGTLPVLAILGFSSLSAKGGAKAGIFFKSVGLLVIALTLFNAYNGFVAAGIVKSGVPRGPSTQVAPDNVSIADGVQVVQIQVRGGYWPRTSVAKAGVPTVLRFNTSGTFDCSSSVRIPSMDISKVLAQSGSTTIDVGTHVASTLSGTCGMGMYPFEVVFE